MTDKNKSLSVLDILHQSYANIVRKISSVFLVSYVIAVFVYFAVMILPGPSNLEGEADLLARLSYIGLFIALLLIVSITFYRLLVFDIKSYRDLFPKKPASVILRTTLYLIAILLLLFIAQLSISLIFMLVASIINNIVGSQVLNEANLPPVVYFTMIAVTLLIVMRLQPTFISIATNRKQVPMKDAYYYTRDNFKELLLIGLFSFVPAMMPILIVLYGLSGATGLMATGSFITFIIFPLFLLPYISVLSAGIEVGRHLVPDQDSKEV